MNIYDERDLETVPAARAALAGVLAEPAASSAINHIAIGHAHIDSAWLWPVRETAAKDDGEIHSGVGVLDKTVKILDALESGPSTLGQLVAATGLARPTAHRLAIALERHRFVLRDQHGRFVLGSRFAELAAAGEDRLLTAAGPILQTLLDRTGESAQIYRRQGDQRVCIAA